MSVSQTTTASPQGSPFWRFSLQFYRQPKVADACIQLQDEAGVDVNLLFFLLWLARQRRTFSTGEVEWLESKVAPWRDATVIPIRNVRRALKVPPALVIAASAELFRTRIKAVELEAERLQQEATYELAPTMPAGETAASAAEAARANVTAYATMLAKPFSPPAVDALLAALVNMQPKPGEE
jgi:uncharacterized protein (TIGR02444 family)